GRRPRRLLGARRGAGGHAQLTCSAAMPHRPGHHAELVADFIAAWHDRDIERICAFLADDIRYHNMPLEPIDGITGTRGALQGLLDRVDVLRWGARFIAHAPDGTVLYEKTEHYLIGADWVALPCMI